MRYVLAVLGIFVLVTSVIVCGDPGEEVATRSLLVVVERSLHEPLRPSLEQYAETLALAEYEVYVERWAPESAEERDQLLELRALLFDYVDSHGIEGALLVGPLPALEYELPAKGTMEEFPTDVFFQDRDAKWADQDDNGYFDMHSPLTLDIYTSRLVGTEKELLRYFARVERYRREGPLVDRSAFVFIDDDWYRKDTSDACGLSPLYSEVEVIQDLAESTKANYIAKLTGDGAEFVYQWIHGAPPGTYPGWLQFDHYIADTKVREKLSAQEIIEQNLKVSFVNMANCYSARFLDDEMGVATAYTVGTSYGLASVGSSKMGAQTDPRLFHEGLARGLRWGQAYKEWYNAVGCDNDHWHLGIILMGDPLLKVSGDLFPAGHSAEAIP
jgi:hypothetical protein